MSTKDGQTTRVSRALPTYVWGLGVAWALAVALSVTQGLEGGRQWEWLVFALLFGAAESVDLIFHHEGGRQSLSPSEAVLVPMVVFLPGAAVLWAVSLGMVGVRLRYLREGLIKSIFNVAQYGLAAGAGAAIYAFVGEGYGRFTARNAVAALVAVACFWLITHVLVAGAIALASGGGFRRLLKDVGQPALLNLAGNLTLGLLFAGTYSAGAWAALLFPLPVAALYLGFRAVVRQSQDRERLSNLHAASRALAVSASLDKALVGFLVAVREMVSTVEARVIVDSAEGMVWSGVRGTQVTADMSPIEGGAMQQLYDRVSADGVIILHEDSGDELMAALEANSVLAIRLVDDRSVVGCLAVIDRVGADDFGPAETQLLEALGHELVLTLDSYRLFAEIAQERERFRKIFDASKEGICLLDGEGIVRAWNPSLVRVTGFTEREILGSVLSDFLVVRDRQHRELEGLEIVSVSPEEEYEVITREGRSRWVSLLCSPTRSTEDKGWVVLVRDVTAEHLVEEAKSDFLSTVSHELRTPLTTIKGSMQMLKRRSELEPATVDQMVGVLSRGTDRLERLVLNLLFVSQIETDGLPPAIPEEVDLGGIVKEKAESFLTDQSAVRLDIEPGSIAWGDKERLTQAIEHLIENAQKFSDGAPVTLRTTTTPEGIHLMVKDEGPGIPQADQERIFERFVRLGDVLTRETQGPGVGLFIVQKSVESMGGKVWCESSPGEGATFHVVLPAARKNLDAPAIVAS